MYKKTVVIIIAMVVLGSALYGCSKQKNDAVLSQNVALNPGVLFGKVVDAQTHRGIPNATVYLQVDGGWLQVTTRTDDGSTPDNADGDFIFSGLPINSTMQMIVKGPTESAFMMYKGVVYISAGSPGANNEISYNVGKIALTLGITATVYVVDADTGAPVNKTGGLAIYWNPIWWMSNSLTDFFATQDAATLNKYTITVPQNASTTLIIPASDVDGNGVLDYAGNSFSINSTSYAYTTNVALSKITDVTTPTIIADSTVSVGDTANGASILNMLGKNDPYRAMFNIPVTLGAGSLTMTFVDNLKVLSAAALETEVAVTAALSNDNTVVTVTPTAALKPLETYSVNGTVFSSSNAPNAQLVYNTISPLFTVKSDATTLAATDITLDNHNWCTAGAQIVAPDSTVCNAGGAALSPMLIFPEPVWGTVRVISTQMTGTGIDPAVLTNGATAPFTGQNTGIMYVTKMSSTDPNAGNNSDGYNREGIVWPVNMNGTFGTLSDNLTGTQAVKVTLGIDVYNTNGAHLVTETEFVVQ